MSFLSDFRTAPPPQFEFFLGFMTAGWYNDGASFFVYSGVPGMKKLTIQRIVTLFMCAGGAASALADLEFGPKELVLAGANPIWVPGYSVPSYVDWNNDGLNDLVIGQGPVSSQGKVSVYLNSGTAEAPEFSSHFFAQSAGADLAVAASGCLGAFPRVVYWDDDDRKDLLLGQSDGRVKIFLNNGTDVAPVFDGGSFLQAGPSGVDIDVGDRATSTVVDWNNDGKKDLAVGAYDGKLRIYLNQGTDAAPDLAAAIFAQNNGLDLDYYDGRLSPAIVDMDGDGRKDLLAGETHGKLLFYSNVGTDESPAFSDYTLALSEGQAISLGNYQRSRPFVCDWTGDGYLDVLVGSYDGNVQLYQGIPEPATMLLVGFGMLMLRRRR
jgi:hypothetical protein